jgi:hypothetical protein
MLQVEGITSPRDQEWVGIFLVAAWNERHGMAVPAPVAAQNVRKPRRLSPVGDFCLRGSGFMADSLVLPGRLR